MDLVIRGAGDAYATGLAERFKAGGDVDAIAENVALVDDDIAEIDADAKLDSLLLRHVSIAPHHAALNLDGTAYRIHHTGELHKHAVSGRLHDPATVLGDLGIEQRVAMGLELGKRALLVGAHALMNPRGPEAGLRCHANRAA